MIRGRGVKVKEIALNGQFGRLYGTKCPANGIRKLLVIKVFGKRFYGGCQKLFGAGGGGNTADSRPFAGYPKCL